MNDLILPRRRFLMGTATLITAAFAGPAIVRADFSDSTRVSPLMDINRQGNRLVVAFERTPYGPYGLEGLIQKESLLNFSQFITPDDYRAWKYFNPGLEYSLQRRDAVDPLSNRIGNMLAQKAMFESDFQMAKRNYQAHLQAHLQAQKAQIII